MQVDDHPASGTPERWIPPTQSGRLGLWRSSGLVDRQHPAAAGLCTTFEHGRVPQVPGTDLGEGVLTPQGAALCSAILKGQKDWADRSQDRSRTAGGTSAVPSTEP